MNGETTDNMNGIFSENTENQTERQTQDTRCEGQNGTQQTGETQYGADKASTNGTQANTGSQTGFAGGQSFDRTYYSSYQPKEKTYYELNKNDYICVGALILLSILGVSTSLWGGFNVGYTVIYLLTFGVLSFYFKSNESKITGFSAVCGFLGVISSSVFAYTNDTTVNFFLLVASFCLSAVWFASLCGKHDKQTDMGLITHICSTTFGLSFGRLDKAVRSVFSSKNKKITGAGKVFIGVAASLPVAGIAIALLASADAAFDGLLQYIGDDIFEIVFKTILGLIVAPFIISYALGLKKKEEQKSSELHVTGIDSTYIIAFLGVLSVIYIVYLFSQLAYFSNAFGGILPKGYTPAKYARRGFFEICVISAINFAVIFIVLFASKKREDGVPSRAVAAECTFISVFSIALIATAIAKMVLYISRFGMTVLRISTSAFMVFLALTFIVLIARCFTKKARVLRTALILATCLLLVLGLGDMDKFIADYNVNAYLNGSLKTVDTKNLEDIGLAAVPSLYRLTKCKDRDVRRTALSTLDDIYYAYNENENSIGSWNYSDYRAYGIFKNEMNKG